MHANVEPAELEKFSALAHRWWDPHSEFRPLHLLNPLRLQWIAARAPLAGARVLDVGCGGGLLSEAMATAGAHVTGIDLAEASLQVARLHALESGVSVEYQLASAEDHTAQLPGTYDVVVCMEMLEHVPDPASIVRALAQLVRPGGWVFVSTLNRNPKSFALGIVAAEYLLRLLPRGTHEFARFLRPSELAAMARESELEVAAIEGVFYNPLSQTVSLTPDTSVNYMMALRRPAP